MTLIWQILDFALSALFIAHLVRLFAQIIRDMNPAWKPKRWLLVPIELCYLVTDPIVKLVSRIVPVIRIGVVQLDLTWTIVAVLITFAQNLIRLNLI